MPKSNLKSSGKTKAASAISFPDSRSAFRPNLKSRLNISPQSPDLPHRIRHGRNRKSHAERHFQRFWIIQRKVWPRQVESEERRQHAKQITQRLPHTFLR